MAADGATESVLPASMLRSRPTFLQTDARAGSAPGAFGEAPRDLGEGEQCVA